MKFILFFSLMSMMAIGGFVLAEEEIVSSNFYQTYLHTSQTTKEQSEFKPIKTSELPVDVLKSFIDSPFGKHNITQVYLIPAENASNWMAHVMKNYSNQNIAEETYVLALTAKESKAQLRFSKSGKLIRIINS